MINRRLLARVMNHILAYPELHDQAACCLLDTRKSFPEIAADMAGLAYSKDSLPERAAEVLGLDAYQADFLFAPEVDVYQLYCMVRSLVLHGAVTYNTWTQDDKGQTEHGTLPRIPVPRGDTAGVLPLNAKMLMAGVLAELPNCPKEARERITQGLSDLVPALPDASAVPMIQVAGRNQMLQVIGVTTHVGVVTIIIEDEKPLKDIDIP